MHVYVMLALVEIKARFPFTNKAYIFNIVSNRKSVFHSNDENRDFGKIYVIRN